MSLRWRGVGMLGGSGKTLIARSCATYMTVVSASPTSLALSLTVPRSARSVRRDAAAMTSPKASKGSSGFALAAHASSIRSVSSTTIEPMAAIFCRVNAGCAMRRCRSQKSPSLVTRPLPKTRRRLR